MSMPGDAEPATLPPARGEKHRAKDGGRARKESARPLETRGLFARIFARKGRHARPDTKQSSEVPRDRRSRKRAGYVVAAERSRKIDPHRGSWGSSTIFSNPLLLVPRSPQQA